MRQRCRICPGVSVGTSAALAHSRRHHPTGAAVLASLSPMRPRAALVLAIVVGLGCGSRVTTGGSVSDTAACEPGTLRCVCRPDSTCDAPLLCSEDACMGEADADTASAGSNTTEPGPDGSETGRVDQVVCCHDEAFVNGDSPYGRIYCEHEDVELGERCSCGTAFSEGIGCIYGGEDRVPFCCWGEIAECCVLGRPPAEGDLQNPWTIACERCSCSPERHGIGSPTWDAADAQCD